MGLQQEIERLADKAGNSAIRTELMATAHKLRFPMAAILAKIPGDTLKERAQAVGVSRQTMYVWMHERFRPGADQAAIIAKLTGVPVWQIRDLQEGESNNDAGRPIAEEAGELESSGEAAPSVHGRIKRRRKRILAAQGRGRGFRTRRKRNSG